MADFKKRFNNIFEIIRKFFVGSDTPESKKLVSGKKWLNLILLGSVFICGVLVMVLFLGSGEDDGNSSANGIDLSGAHKKIELGSDATKADVKWHNFLEESIETEGKTRHEQIEMLRDVITKTQETSKEEVDSEFSEVKARLAYALNEIDRLKADNKNIKHDIDSLNPEDAVAAPAELGITAIVESPATKAPISSYNHIPATSYVSGHLLGGIAVSTSVNSASEPIPVIIKLTNRGNLPADFAVEMKQCRLLASCYGDISSERAIIRAEELVCENKSAGLITSTKVSGVIYGDDGANGIRGTVVSMSEKHLKNAMIGGVLSGFSNSAKGQDEMNVTAFGALNSKKKQMKEMAQDGLLGGVSNAAEKLADYHIKLAENISPVILVPGGTKVDVMFTKSVEVGSVDIEGIIAKDRVGQ